MSDVVIAAIIGATATAIVALSQFVLAWRKQSLEQGKSGNSTAPTKRKSSISLSMIMALMLCSAVAGFGYSEYHAFEERQELIELKRELQVQLKKLNEAVERYERVVLKSQDAFIAVKLSEKTPGNTPQAMGMLDLSACVAAKQAGEPATSCKPDAILQAVVCAAVPVQAKVTDVRLFAREAMRDKDSAEEWEKNRVALGQESVAGKFIAPHFEKTENDKTKSICQKFEYHPRDKERQLRIVVHYQD